MQYLSSRACAAIIFWICAAASVQAQGAAIREGGEQLLRAVSKYLGKPTAQAAVEELAEHGGEAAVRRVAQKALSEGGEPTLNRMVATASKYGPDAVRMFDNVPTVSPVLKSLDEIPEEVVSTALKRLAAGQPGRELAEVAEQYGGKAILVELKHPGVGTGLVRSLGDEGVRIGDSLATDQAIVLAKHADDIAKLPAAQRAGILDLLHRDATGVVGFIGRFMEKHPGKTLFAASATTIILANPERILGGDEIVLDANGVPHLVSKPGLMGRTTEHAVQSVVRPLMTYVIPLAAVAFAAWLGIKLWAAYSKAKISVERKRKVS